MKGYVVTVVEIPGEKTQEFVEQGKYSLLNRLVKATADAAFSVPPVASEAKTNQVWWTDDEQEEFTEDWQKGLMNADWS